MTHARDWLRRDVRAAVRLPLTALLLSAAPALAQGQPGEAGAEGKAGLSLSTSGDSKAHGEASGTGDVKADTSARPSVRELLGDRGNPANYEFAFVSVGAYQAWGLAGRTLFFGAGGGLGPPLYRYSSVGGRAAAWDPSLEVIYGNVFLRLAAGPHVELDVGPKIAIVSALYAVKDPPQSGFSYAGYADLRVGTKDIKFGPRFEYGQSAYHDYRESSWRLTPLMVRVVH